MSKRTSNDDRAIHENSIQPSPTDSIQPSHNSQSSMNDTESSLSAMADDTSDQPGIRFRTYQPFHKDLKPLYKPTKFHNSDSSDNSLNDLQAPVQAVAGGYQWITEETKELVELAEGPDFDKFLDYDVHAKPTWDLKRDIEPKMHLLEEQTQLAIQRMVQQRLLADMK